MLNGSSGNISEEHNLSWRENSDKRTVFPQSHSHFRKDGFTATQPPLVTHKHTHTRGIYSLQFNRHHHVNSSQTDQYANLRQATNLHRKHKFIWTQVTPWITGQLADTPTCRLPTRRLDNSRTGRLLD